MNCHKLYPNAADGVRSLVADCLHKFLCRNKHIICINRLILNEFTKCKKFLHDDGDVFVTKTDKNQVTMVMNRSDYVTRMNELLSDQSTYRKKIQLNNL